MRKTACARPKDSDTFDVVATTGDETQSTCPLASALIDLSGTSHANFLHRLIELGIVQRDGHLIYKFAPMHGFCPFTQPQPNTQPLEDKQP